MGNRLQNFPLTLFLFVVFHGVTGFSIRNELLGKCVQVQDGRPRGVRVVLEECSPASPLQEWQWLPETQALSSVYTGDCLTALRVQQHESVRLQSCSRSGVYSGVDGGVAGGEKEEDDKDVQSWMCTKKGHLALQGKGLHLSVRQDSSKIFLSKERGQVSKWRFVGNGTGCNERGDGHRHHHHHHHVVASSLIERSLSVSTSSNQSQPGGSDQNTTDPWSERLPRPQSTAVPEEPSIMYFSMDYGMGWKVTMLVLSSLALVLGALILILNVHHNRRRKVVCVLKSYTPAGELSPPGSPVPSERAPLTRNALRPPRSPAPQRGEILIEWKDGTVTPLFESCLVE
ncbi:uncharacterized protein si:dkey-245n4.2 [Osmerus mordax]|uniref:uncharacterized protein si:dkey-245n4.2 n=1 Tax=Osmerus mordax TaxID=8014 RepID=UPI00350FFAE7